MQPRQMNIILIGKKFDKNFIKSYLKDEDTSQILSKAEEIENNSNQLLSFTKIIKENSMDTKKEILNIYGKQ